MPRTKRVFSLLERFTYIGMQRALRPVFYKARPMAGQTTDFLELQ